MPSSMASFINRDLLHRAAEKPPRILLWKGWQLLLRQARKRGYWPRLSSRLQGQISRIPVGRLRSALTGAPQLFCPTRLGSAAECLRAQWSDQTERIMRQGERYVSFSWYLLGRELRC